MLAVAAGEKLMLLAWPGLQPLRGAALAPQVTAVAWHPDGRRLAAAAGEPGRSGRLLLLDAETLERRQVGTPHTDLLYSLAFDSSGRYLAAAGYDRLIRLHDLRDGASRTLREHTDSIFDLAFGRVESRDLLASASADRTVKIWDASSGRRLYSLTGAAAELSCVTFIPGEARLVAGGADRVLRSYALTRQAGVQQQAVFAHEAPLLQVRPAPGGRLVTTAEDGAVRFWRRADLAPLGGLSKQPSWPLGAAGHEELKLLAITRFDGAVAVYDSEGKPAAERRLT